MSKEVALREAEAFVRKAIARVSVAPVDEAAIKSAALKVTKVTQIGIAPERTKDKVAA